MLTPYTVLYRDDSLLPADAPYSFVCQAEDSEHAEEQCTNAYPECEVVWVVLTSDVDLAYQNYWGNDDSLN